MSSNSRRRFIQIGSASFAGLLSLSPFAQAAALARKRKVTSEEFLKASELSTQKDLLIDSIIRKNPQHIQLSEAEISQLKAEGSDVLQQIFEDLIAASLSESDMAEITEHLSTPAEKKWTRFNKMAVEKARAAFIGKVEEAITKKRKV